MFTSAAHAAAPHNAVMNIRLFLGGLCPPKPSQGAGSGCAGRRPASAEVWGNPVSPYSWAYVHVSCPCGFVAQRRNEHTFVLGRAKPSHTLPRVGENGETRFPHSPAGRGRGETRFPHTPRRGLMFTLGTYAAALQGGCRVTLNKVISEACEGQKSAATPGPGGKSHMSALP